jgi:hypothetical protein
MRGFMALGVWICAICVLGASSSPRTAPPGVRVQMKNVRLHADEGIILDIQTLSGVMVSRTGAPPVFDNQRSYLLQVDAANLSMSIDSLQTLLNRYVFSYDGAPLKNIKLSADGDRLKMSATLHKGIDVPISTKGRVAAAADGRVGVHVDSVKALGVPAKGLLDLLGLKLDDLVHLKAERGIDVSANDILIAPGQILPPPEIRGRVTRVSLVNDRLVQVFDGPGRPKSMALPAPGARNYIYFGGGTVTFGKLTMADADLQLIDADPRDPFDFYPARYQAQLIAGYSKNTPARGLKTYMPDYDDLRRRR